MFSPLTQADRKAMLEAIGVARVSDLFAAVPEAYRYPALRLPPPLTEMEVAEELQALSEDNETARDLVSFLGAGAYNHYIPAAVDAILSRGEYYTAYTPYQPEISQGTLQALFEYQSMVCALTGMEVANASHYDGATAVAEAAVMAYHVFRGKRPKVVLSPSLHPHYRETTRTYTQGSPIVFAGDDLPPAAPPEALLDEVDDQTALVMVQYPDFFGRVYDFTALAEEVHARGALFGVAVNPLALGLLKPPGEMGADIVTGEGQPLGIPLSFGGPYLGLFATRKKYVRKMAGRLVGQTVDSRGQRAFVLTLSAREQHIRRERATSNICSNQGLMTLAVAVYLSLLGKEGLRQVAELNYQKAHYAARKLAALPGYELVFPETPFFNEFALRCPGPADEIAAHLLEHDVIAGFPLGEAYGEAFRDVLLVAVTEMNPREEIDLLAEMLGEVH